MLVGDIPRRNARRYPTKTAVLSGGTALTWAAVNERANRLGTALRAAGLHTGDRVAVCSRNTAEWPEIVFGLAKAGLVAVPINIRLSAPEIAHQLTDSGARAGIVHSDQTALAGEVFTAQLELVVQIGGEEAGKDYESVLAGSVDADPTPATLTHDDVQFLLYTSGTTGHPKGVVQLHRGMVAQALDTSLATEAVSSDVTLGTTPCFTAGGMVRTVSGMFLGQTLVLHPRFDPEQVVAEIERSRVTMTTFIPTMLMRTLKVLENGPDRDVSSLRRISYGSAPVPPGLAQEAMARLGCDLQQRYGATEAGGQATILTPADHRAAVAGDEGLLASCGRETAMAEIRIVDEAGEDLPTGETGEIVVRSDMVAAGYWNRPEASAETFRPTGLWTGDLGRLDERGYLYIAGRKTDMIISGGFNVYPAEIERVLAAHPGVDLVTVVGLPDPEWGETPVAVVVRSGTPDPGLEESLREHCRGNLAGYKQPRRFEFRDELPLGPAGKILKREVRAALLAPAGG
ncbi:class I adenylate-forming enzyme family protein [Pseudonocardia pini]|uniref:class I adenylate-forming enzyme family protein n=1 Tax=Pseudonocardia pini TaxID=2758030 RepID=UPI0015EFFE5D|nr:AMP-binding protein [Pseudonocardia pini]